LGASWDDDVEVGVGGADGEIMPQQWTTSGSPKFSCGECTNTNGRKNKSVGLSDLHFLLLLD
jgi:hypothetical protein